uniref:CopG family transcriptional regulator n=1 Tax=Streptomyces sp. NBC_00049 TaxID=2903617 RepID=A0AAU2JQT6_9ACTN
MNEMNIGLSDAEWAELHDLADATGRPTEEVALEAVRAHLRAERERVAEAAGRLAGQHAALLRRLGQ